MENFEATKFYDSSISSGDESDHELEQLYGLPKVTSDSEQTITKNVKRKRNGEDEEEKQNRQRLPTRKPDPNVFNRNALLARENRRKKKAHLESLEHSLQECKRVNTALLTALKRQRKMTRRVERERQYYKNLLANRSDITSLVAALNGRLRESSTVTPTRSMNCYSLNQTSDIASSPTRDSLYSRSGSSSYEPDYQAFDNFDGFSDNELERQPTNITLEDNWTADLLQDNEVGLGSERASDADTDMLTNISNDHCYVNQQNNADETLKDVGICLHLSAGKLSLEFCPTCNWNASQTPPQQLLQEISSL